MIREILIWVHAISITGAAVLEPAIEYPCYDDRFCVGTRLGTPNSPCECRNVLLGESFQYTDGGITVCTSVQCTECTQGVCVNGAFNSTGCFFQDENAICDCVPGWIGLSCDQSTTATTQPPGTTATTQPSGTTATTQPPDTTATTQPPDTTDTTQPPGTTDTTQHPDTTATTQPPDTTDTTQPPDTTATTQPPDTTDTTNPPGTTATTQSPDAVGETTSSPTTTQAPGETTATQGVRMTTVTEMCDRKCKNGGTCVDGNRCICPKGFCGRTCSFNFYKFLKRLLRRKFLRARG